MVFSGLFLPSVEWEMKAEGFPWHEMESEPGDFGRPLRGRYCAFKALKSARLGWGRLPARVVRGSLQ